MDTSGDDSDSNDSSSLQESEIPRCLDLVAKYMDEFIVRGIHGAMQWMLDLRTYGRKIHSNSTVEGSIDWVGNQMSWKGSVQFTMDELRDMLQDLVWEAKGVLFDDLMFMKPDEKMPILPWSSLRDNARNEEVGWNYIQDERISGRSRDKYRCRNVSRRTRSCSVVLSRMAQHSNGIARRFVGIWM